jgi:hypothetical protein
MQHPFDNPAFNMAALTAAINIIPNRYGLLGEIGLFAPKPVRTRSVLVEEYAGRLTLLPTRPVGSPGTVAQAGKRRVRSFIIPHIPHDDVILPDEVQGLRAFGSETEMEALSSVMARHLADLRNKHAITLEHLRMGAIKGQILDADGSVLVDLFAEYGITQQTLAFDLANANANIKKKCYDLLRAVEDNLLGEVSTGVMVLCSPEFFDALTTHPKVEAAYARWQEGQVLIDDMRAGFTFAGITFREYRGQVTAPDGTTRRFIAAGEAHAFPLGTMDTFATYFAPADFNETVNTLGQELYAKQEPREFDRGVNLHSQSNPLPMCHRPGVLVKLTV